MIDVLIVDDNPLDISMLSSVLSKDKSMHIYFVNDSELAVPKAKELKPSIILLDQMMPKMSGFEVMTALASDTETRDIPVIFVSASDNVEDKLHCYQLGCVNHLTKPVNVDELAELIRDQQLTKLVSESTQCLNSALSKVTT